MKPLALRFSIALLTLTVGITVAFWVKHRDVQKNCSDANYFPVEVFAHDDKRGERLGKYYSAQLELPLSCLDEAVEAYRILFIPSFAAPTAIRIWQVGDQKQIAIKQLTTDGIPEVGPKDLRINVTRPLSPNEWNHFQELLKKSNFWSMPSADVKERGFDGATFLLEGKRSSQYHVVDRWFPEDQDFLEACGYLMELSKLEWKH